MQVSAQDDEAGALRSFQGWLQRDDDVARAATVSSSSATSGAMGAVDVINVMVTQVIAFGQLALAYAAWRRSRPAAPPLTFTVNTVTVTAIDASPETIAAITALAEIAARGGGGS